MLGKVASAIGDAGGTIGSVDLVSLEGGHTLRDITVDTAGDEHGRADRRGDRGRRRRDGDRLPPTARCACTSAARSSSTTSTRSRPATTSRWPTRRASRASAWRSTHDRDKAFQYTIKRNTVAVVSDGSAVLGLGDIGPEASMPVMEGKCMLFKEFAGVDALPDLPQHQGPGRDRRDRRGDRARLRRHQPRGHLRAALLRDRGAAARVARHPRLPRRPARHRGRHARRAAQRGQAHRQAPRGPQRADRRARRRRRRGRRRSCSPPASATSIGCDSARRAAHRSAPTTSTARCRRSSAGSRRRPTRRAAPAAPPT